MSTRDPGDTRRSKIDDHLASWPHVDAGRWILAGLEPAAAATLRMDVTPWAKGLNARGHWTVKAREATELRSAAGWTARASRRGPAQPLQGPLVAVAVLHRSSRRHADHDNVAGVLKPVLDGLVDVGWLRDDSWVHLDHARIAALPRPEGGATGRRTTLVVGLHRPLTAEATA